MYARFVADLSDKELAAAAREAGISPDQLKTALVNREAQKVEKLPAKQKGGPVVQAQFPRSAESALRDMDWTVGRQVNYEKQGVQDGALVFWQPEFDYRLKLASAPTGPSASVGSIEIDISPRMKKLRKGMLLYFGLISGLYLLSGVVLGAQFAARWYIVPMMVVVMGVQNWRRTKKETTAIAQKHAKALLAQSLGPNK